MKFDQEKNHIGGKFDWEVRPDCCGMLIDAVEEEKFVFVGNFTSDGWNNFYMMPVTNEGAFARSSGIGISHCPWCGVEIKGRKRYPSK